MENIFNSIPTSFMVIYCVFAIFFAGKAYNCFAEMIDMKIQSNKINFNSTPNKVIVITLTIIASIIIGFIFPVVFLFAFLPIKIDEDENNDDEDNDNNPNNIGNSPNYAL